MREWPYNLIGAVSPERKYEGSDKDLIPSIMYAIYSLSAFERDVIRYKYEGEYSFSYIAEVTGKSYNYCITSHNNALRKLRTSKLNNILIYGVQGVAARQLQELKKDTDIEIPIEHLDLSIKSYNALLRAGLRTADIVAKLSAEQFLSIKGLLLEQRAEIVTALQLAGFDISHLSQWNSRISHVKIDADRVPIELLDLSVRSYNALKRAGIHTVQDLVSMEPTKFVAIRNLGILSRQEIRKSLEAAGYNTDNLKEV